MMKGFSTIVYQGPEQYTAQDKKRNKLHLKEEYGIYPKRHNPDLFGLCTAQFIVELNVCLYLTRFPERQQLKCLNFTVDEALFCINLHVVGSVLNIGKQGITCRRSSFTANHLWELLFFNVFSWYHNQLDWWKGKYKLDLYFSIGFWHQE